MIFQRKLFNTLLDESGSGKVSIILGPRQTGKTTALRFLQNTLCAGKKNPGLMLDLDIFSQFESVSSYERALATFQLHGYTPESASPFFLFLDEFQRFSDVTMVLKNVVDHHKNIKIYATGSSSLGIKNAVQETLAGRKNVSTLLPLSFEEFLVFKGREDLSLSFRRAGAIEGERLSAALGDIDLLLEEFLRFGGYPEVALCPGEKQKRETLRGIFDLFVKKELVEYLKIEKIQEAKSLVQYLAINNGQKIKYNDVAQISRMSQKTAKHYIELLKETYMVLVVKPFYRNRNKELVKIPKVYFIDPGVSNFFINNFNRLDIRRDAPYLFEGFVAAEIVKSGVESDLLKFWQDKNGNEVDFVIEKEGVVSALEVKYKQVLAAGDFRQLRIFADEYKDSRLFLINPGTQKKIRGARALLPYSINKIFP